MLPKQEAAQLSFSLSFLQGLNYKYLSVFQIVSMYLCGFFFFPLLVSHAEKYTIQANKFLFVSVMS